MKKNKLSYFMLLFLSSCLISCGNNTNDSISNNSSNDISGTYNITMWCSDTTGVKESFEKQIKEFEKMNNGITINAKVDKMGENDVANQMLKDVKSGPDLFCFAQDQLVRFVQAGALNQLGEQTSMVIKSENDESSIQAATIDNKLYCYPLTSDNGYFMYYDKRYIKESSLDSLEAIIKDCKDNNKLFSFELEGSAWYNASFMFATGCKSSWSIDNSGKFTKVDDTFNSENGIIALKGMQKLLKSSVYHNSSNTADFSTSSENNDNGLSSAVVISGTWGSNEAKKILGENYGATDLPSFEIDGKTYHLSSFKGNKLMGVKPQSDSKKAALLQQLAIYLTNNLNQLERFNQFGWGPSNKKAQENEKIKNDLALSALAKQNEFAILQGQIHGSWWDIAKSYATAAKNANNDAELEIALNAYKHSIDGLFK